ncbi:MAG: hypothetical protein R2880_01745 [Deinococcales bacterium]
MLRGPTYQEWLSVLKHHVSADFEELKALSQRLNDPEDISILTMGQRRDLLERLGHMQHNVADRKPIGYAVQG